MRALVRRSAIVATLFLLALLSRADADVPLVEISVSGPDGSPVARGLVLLYRPVPREHFYAADRGDPPTDQARRPEDRAGIREGRAFLSLPGPGIWRVVATAPGLAPSAATLEWSPGFPAPKPALCLGPAGTIEGEVRGANGHRLVGATILARSRLLDFEVRARTDKEGRYRLSGLIPGSHGLWVRRTDGLWVADLLFHSPTLTRRDIRLSADAKAKPGTVPRRSVGTGVDTSKAPVTVTGVVRDGHGDPIPLARVQATNGRPVVSDADGRFRVAGRARPGWAFSVAVSREGYADETTYVNAEDPDTWEGIEVVLSRRPVLRGRVVSSAGLPVGGGLVWVGGLHMDKASQYSGTWGLGPATTIRADGTFEVPVASQTEIDSRGSSSWTGTYQSVYVVGVLVVGHGPAVSKPVEIVPGRMEYPVRVDLAPGLRLSGVVRDSVTGKPVVGAEVSGDGDGMHAWPQRYPPISGFAVRAFTDEKGHFEIDGLPAGRHSLSVDVRGLEDGWWQVDLPSEGVLECELRPFREIAGVVVDASGRPDPDATVYLLESGGERWERETGTDRHGRFRFPRVPAGEHTVIAHRSFDDDPCAPAVATAVPAGKRDLRLVRRTGEVMAGRVLDADGRPIEGVVVKAGAVSDRPANRFERTDADGKYRLEGLPSGPLTVEILDEEMTIRGVRSGIGVTWVVDGKGTISGRIRCQEFDVLHNARGELEAIPLEDRTPQNVTRRWEARIDHEDGTFTFRRLLPGAYRIEGEVKAWFRMRRQTFRVRGEVVAKAGDRDVEVRLVLAQD